ncbi:hypothetical protein KBY24_19665 [Ruegeria pomeroyi]|nr:hypothetical protein [Ruegeria pomeroyi]
MSDGSKGNPPPSRIFWMAIGGIAVFLATNFFADPIKRIGNDLYSSYLEARDFPVAWLCAPLQEARFIARQGGEIISDGTMGHPNPTSIVFFSNKTELNELQMLVYPLGHHENDPIIYQSQISSSDIISGQDTEVKVDKGILRISVPRMAPKEFIHIEALYGQPISLILEVRSEDFVGEFHGIAGCSGIPESFSGPPAEVIHQFVLSNCGDNGGEACGIPGPSFEFEVTEERVMPTLEQWIVSVGEKQYIVPGKADP